MNAAERDSHAPEDLLATAERVAAEAAAFVAAERATMLAGSDVDVQTKGSRTDVVTAVDVASERLLRRRLGELRPGEPVIGEEGGADEAGADEAGADEGGADEAGADEAGTDGVTWVVDPIDGTVNFLYGLPDFAVSVAAQIGGRSVAGAVVEPVSGRRWTGARGLGAWLDGTRLQVSSPADLGMTMLGTGFTYLPERRRRQAAMVAALVGDVRDVRRGGAASLELCHVAAGWTDAYVEHGLSRWDWAAGALLAEEAGAVVAVPGQDPEMGQDGTFVAAPSIADALRERVIACGIRDV